jgi:hypothetical protein
VKSAFGSKKKKKDGSEQRKKLFEAFSDRLQADYVDPFCDRIENKSA